MKTKRCLVSGCCGYIGTHLVKQLLSDRCEVIGIDNGLVGWDSIKSFKNNSNFKLIKGDICESHTWLKALKSKPDYVFHLAGIVGDPACLKDTDLSYEVNVMATREGAKLCKKAGVKKFIMASTCTVYGNQLGKMTEENKALPIDWYGRTKIVNEVDLQKIFKKDELIITRFATAGGVSPRMRFDLVLNVLCLIGFNKRKLMIDGTGKQRRPLTNCEDLARSMKFLVDNNASGVYNISNENFEIVGLAKLIKKQIGKSTLEFREIMEDWRSYNVSSQKILDMGFKFKHTITKTITTLLNSLKAGKYKDYKKDKYYNDRLKI